MYEARLDGQKLGGNLTCGYVRKIDRDELGRIGQKEGFSCTVDAGLDVYEGGKLADERSHI